MTNNNKTELEIIILNYNTSRLTKKLAGRLLASKPDNWLITIVDNHSSEPNQNKLLNLIPKNKRGTGRIKSGLKIVTWPGMIKIIFNPKNTGFGAGNNLALKQSEAEYVLLLNSDIETDIKTIKKLLAFLKTKPQASVATPKLTLKNNRLDWACHRGLPTPWSAFTYFTGLEKLWPKIKIFSQYHLRHLDLDRPHQVDAVSGAFFLARRQDLAKVNFFDEDYFMYGEDIDLCYRLKEQGRQIWYYPYLSAIHLKHQAGIKSKSASTSHKSKKHFYQAMKIFYQKHQAKKQNKPINWLINVGIKLLSRTAFK